MGEHPHDVFISHASKDRTVAQAVCAILEREGVRCWMAPRDVLPGADWPEAIVRAIKGARIFLLIFSSFANASDQVKREVERAAHQELPIIPFRIDEVLPNDSLQYFISTAHWLDALTPPLEAHAEQLAETIKRLLAPGAEPAPPPAPTKPLGFAAQIGRGPRRAWVWGAGAAAAGVLALAIALMAGGGEKTKAVAQPSPPVAPAASPGWAGFQMASLDAQIAQVAGLNRPQGVYVTDVLEGPAREAGLRRGDVILDIADQPVADVESVGRILAGLAPGDSAAFGVLRGSGRETLNVRLGTRPPPDVLARLSQPAAPVGVTPATTPLEPEAFDVARWIELSHYPDTQLWEFSRLGSDAVVAYLVPRSGEPIQLDGRSPALHTYNTRIRLDLNHPSQVASYLRFYTSHVWGEAGAFNLIEHPSDLPAGTPDSVKAQVRPLTVTAAGDAFEVTALTFHGGALSEAVYRVQRDGTTAMLGDRPVARDLPRPIIYGAGQRRPASLEGVEPGYWPLPPLVPGAWRNATADELARVRQLIITARNRTR